jgi:Family of unknown function (DUF6221)
VSDDDDAGGSGVADPRLGAHIAITDLIDAELGCLENAAVAAKPTSSRHRGWVALPSDSGLTEEQEDFIDCWSPQRVLDDCQAKRRLIAWALNAGHLEPRAAIDDSELTTLLMALVYGPLDHDLAE